MTESAEQSMWYYADGGRQIGPVPLDYLRGLLSDGTLPWTSLVWTQGMTDWLPAQSVAAVTGVIVSEGPTVHIPSLPETQMNYFGTTDAPKPQGLAVTSLVLGTSAFGLFCIHGINLLTPLAALGAVVTGIMARRRVKRGEAAGGGMALAGMVLGFVYLSILAAVLVMGIVFAVVMVRTSNMGNGSPPSPAPVSPTSIPIER